MAGLVLDRTVPPSSSRLSASPTRLVALVAVAFGLLFGAMACVAGLAGGGHGTVERSSLELDEMPMAHADHLATMTQSESQSMPPGDHGEQTGSSSMAAGHPGMACVVSVDLHFPEASSVAIAESFEFPLIASGTGCPADVDPPVPRFS